MNLKKIKDSYVCANCGDTLFHIRSEEVRCDYCGTVYKIKIIEVTE